MHFVCSSTDEFARLSAAQVTDESNRLFFLPKLFCSAAKYWAENDKVEVRHWIKIVRQSRSLSMTRKLCKNWPSPVFFAFSPLRSYSFIHSFSKCAGKQQLSEFFFSRRLILFDDPILLPRLHRCFDIDERTIGCTEVFIALSLFHPS